MSARDTLHGICRSCAAMCPLVIERENGVPVSIIGDKHNPVYWGYSCIKGREMVTQLRHPDRLTKSVRKEADGTFTPIASAQALDEIAAKLQKIIAEHGPRAVATYAGTYIFTYPATQPVSTAWMEAIGSRMMFTSNTIDQPGKVIAPALHGTWQAGPQVFDDADTWLLVGVNPIVAHSGGVPNQNPAKRLKDAVARGMKPIVIDPRRSECAERAFVHLQPRPGEDPAVLAGMIRVILHEQLFDAEFVRAHVKGVEALRAAVEPYTADYVAARADIPVVDLLRAARTFAQASRGGATAGTGPNMAGNSNLVEYLLLALMSLCGRWLKAGERVPNPGVLGPRFAPRAQANAPWPVYVPGGETMRVRGFREAVVGLPVSALADEILLPGEGQVKALISIGGNPLMAWPDQRKTLAALKALDLFVCLDIQMAHNSCHHAHYTVACKHSLESPAMTLPNEMLSYFGTGFGYAVPYAQYAPAAAAPPPGSDLIEEWEFFYGIAKRMQIELEMKVAYSWTTTAGEPARYRFDMQHKPTTDDLFEVLCDGGRVPLTRVKERPEGRVFDDETVIVAAAEPGSDARLQVGDALMCAELEAIATAAPGHERLQAYPFRLISRRTHGVMNSTGRNNARQMRGQGTNPAYMHPLDLRSLGLAPGDEVRIRSQYGEIPAIVAAEDAVKRGVISMSHCFGTDPDRPGDVRTLGSNTGLLSSVEHDYDRFSGIPRMSAIPVRVETL
jgi:anaerobic selenocysteine-containing dehydrogenase